MQTLLSPTAIEEPAPRRWTKAEYYRMAELGWFHGQRAELIEGEIVVLSPQKFAHGQVADRATEILRGAFGANFWAPMQLALNLGPKSEPEPDVSVVPGRREDYHDHPNTALLVVEVSDTTLAYDRAEKASLYASAGILDYWVLDLVHRRLHVYRDPAPDATRPYGYGYKTVSSLQPGETVVPLAAPSARILVADLLG